VDRAALGAAVSALAPARESPGLQAPTSAASQPRELSTLGHRPCERVRSFGLTPEALGPQAVAGERGAPW
jgi:hypothetical protein